VTLGNQPSKLSIRNLSKTYGQRGKHAIPAVENLSFDVRENEFCTLLGPSGCGKSSVLRIVAGLEAPSAGYVSLDGQEIEGADRARGMVFQDYTSFPWLTVQQNVEYGMKLNGVRAAERGERADHFIRLVKLDRFKDAYPRQLSGGMKQRVAIARTLANEPNVLLMDEPFGALDADTRWSMQELMVSIMDSTKITVVMVTHDLEEALFLSDTIIVMSKHPGSLLRKMTTSFKSGARIADKAKVLSLDGYAEAEQEIIALMRGQMHAVS
jgi:NitT/TauT family transport system ATP-binding protein